MSIKAIYDLLLHYDSFLNIDLSQFGIYCIRTRFYTLSGDEKTKIFNVIPYLISDIESDNPPDLDIMNQGILDCEKGDIISKALLLKINKEKYKLNQMFHFKLELEAFPDLKIPAIHIEAELLHSPMGPNLENEKKNDKNAVWLKIGANEFKVASSYNGIIRHLHNNFVNEYFPINFEGNGFCQMDTYISIFLSCINFKKDNYYTIPPNNVDLKIRKPKNVNELIKMAAFNYPNQISPKTCLNYIELFRSSYRLLKHYLLRFENNPSKKKIFESDVEISQRLKEPAEHLEKENSEDINQSNQTIASKNQIPPSEQKPSLKATENQQEIIENTLIEILENRDTDNAIIFFHKDSFPEMFDSTLRAAHKLSGKIFEMINRFMKVQNKHFENISKSSKKAYLKNENQKFSENVLRCNKFGLLDLSLYEKNEDKANYFKLFKKQRKLKQYHLIEDLTCVNELPLIFDEFYAHKNFVEANLEETFSSKDKHLFILVHGFGGNQFDTKLIESILKSKFKNAQFMRSVTNERFTDGKIEIMGENLAREINYKIEDLQIDFKKISFIGHSLGGVIIRAALPYLSHLSSKFYTLLTLSSPHLGLLYMSNNVVEVGMWFMKAFKKNESITQLKLEDDPDYRKCFLYKLSEAKGLDWFKNVIFVGSVQDGFIPYESARIQKSLDSVKDSRRGHIYAAMADNIFSNLQTKKIRRLEVNFFFSKKKDIDGFIGRKAHMNFLTSRQLWEMMSGYFQEIFE